MQSDETDLVFALVPEPTEHDLAPILDRKSRLFHVGLALPTDPTRVSSFKPLRSVVTVYTDDECRDILANPDRTPARRIWSDPAWTTKGDQKQHSSCAGWGGANATGKMRWKNGNQKDGVQPLSGSYAYAWCNRNQDEGAPLEEIMQAIMLHGLPPADLCDSNHIFRSQTKQFDDVAAKIKGLNLLTIKSQAEFNTACARGWLVISALQVDRSQYVNFSGNGLVPAFKGMGNHCIHVHDYRWNDQAKRWEYDQAGNWGREWGEDGCGWGTWASFAQPIQNHTFYAVFYTTES